MDPVPGAFRALQQLISVIVVLAPRHAAASVMVTLAVSATEGFGLLLLVPLLHLVGFETGQQDLAGIVGALNRGFGAVGLTPTLPLVLAVYVAVIAVQAALGRRQLTLSAEVGRRVGNGLRRRLYRAIAGTEWVFFSRHRASDAMHLLTSEIERTTTAVHYLLDLLATSLATTMYLALALRVSTAATLFVLTIGASLALVLRGPMRRSKMAGEKQSTATADFYAAIVEHLGSMKLAKGYGAVARHAAIFDGLVAAVAETNVEATRQYGRLRQHITTGSAVVLAVLVYVSHAVLRIGTVQLLFLLFLFARVMPRLTGVYERVQNLVSTLPALTAILETEARCDAAAEPTTTETVAVTLQNELRIDGVTFGYQTGDEPALRGITMTVPAGTTVAIVGVSGSGKSTLADIIMGLLQPSQGRVEIDGIVLDATSRDGWRARVGLVPQDTFLFHDTVRANLTWGNVAATDEAVWRALKAAAADGFVAALPRGLDTIVGDRGVLLSGGERQRLSLARALVREPQLLILDEATSALDSENETRIQEAIDGLQHQVTIIAITHRLSTIRRADIIHVLERGRIVESGSWTDLVSRKSGRFRALRDAQGLA